MIHILKDKKGNFYWLSVVRKANTFEENGKSSEFYVDKRDCKKSIVNEAKIFQSSFPLVSLPVVDHTIQGDEHFGIAKKEIDWVKSRK
jgi:uncharacterized protein YegP (UPF0339 family)